MAEASYGMTKKMELVDLAMSEKGGKDFLDSKEGAISQSSMKTYKMHLGVAVKYSHDMFDKSLLDLTEREAQLVANKLVEEKKSATTIGILVRMFYKYHKRKDLTEAFRTKTGRKKRIDPAEILTVKEVNELIKATSNLRDRCIIAVLWESGARIHEVLSLKMSNIRLVKNGKETHYKVFFGKVKVRGEEHSCLLVESSSHMKAWLDSYSLSSAPDAPLFPTFSRIGGSLSYNGFRDSLRRSIEKTNLKKKIYSHLFRHSRATFLLREGWTEALVNKYMGWAPGSPMIGRYSHLSDQDIDNKVYEMHGMKAPEPQETERLVEAMSDEMSATAPRVAFPEEPLDILKHTDVETLLNHPDLVKRLDELIRARVEEQYGNWEAQVETGELSKAMDERTDKISIAVKKAVKEVDPNAVVESIEVSFPEVQKMQKK